jgi:hypothetical protein
MKSLATVSKEESRSAYQLGIIRTMLYMCLTEEHQIEIFGRKIQPLPDFRAELMEEGGGFPAGVDHTWADN